MRRYHQPLRGAPPASRLTPREDPVEIWRNRHRNSVNLCLITIFNGKIHYFYGKSQFFWGKLTNIWLMMMVNIWLIVVHNVLLVGGIPTPLKNDGVKVS